MNDDKGGSGSDERRGRRRAAPRPWVPAFARTTMGGVRVGGELLVVGGARLRPRPVGPAAPVQALRFQAQGERPPRPRMALSRWVPACAGITRGGGVREGRDKGAPPVAPALDSRFRGNDDVGGRVGGGCWWRRGESPAAAGRALRETPLRRGVESAGMRRGWWWEAPRVPSGQASTGSGRTELRGARATGCGVGGDAPGLVVGGPSTGSGRTDLGSAPTVGELGMRCGMETPRAAPLWIPAFAGMTLVGECGPAGAAGGGRPFDRLRANGIAVSAGDGVWGEGGGVVGRGRRRGEGYSSGRGIQRALKSWG